jgi:hypothetical protein
MNDKFRSYVSLARWSATKGSSLWVIFITILCGVLYVVGKTHGDLKASFLSLPWIEAVLGELAALGIAAIISGAVLKVLLVQGYFKQALAEVIHGDAGLDLLPAERRIELWRGLTQRIYMPVLQEQIRDRPSDVDLQRFEKALSESISSSFNYDRNEYNRDVDLEVTVSWADETRKEIVLTNYVSFTLIPIDISVGTQWVYERSTEAHMQISEFFKHIHSVMVDGLKPDEPKVELIGRNTERTTYRLAGKHQYKIVAKDSLQWKLDNDPSAERTSILVADGFRLRLENKAPGLRIVFLEVGGTGLFDAEKSDRSGPDELIEFGQMGRWRAKRVILPDQGYRLIFVRMPSEPMES